ncbi:MAG: hypothetical protein F4Y58_00125 [Gammaproteobacteria bacterium]|nr:hypothetical protein [Gammaproteobacteria bacterium]
MAVALSLLIVLPTLAQVSGDRTDGRLSVGNWIDVRVADNLADVLPDGSTETTIGTTQRAVGDAAFDAQDTYFDGNLYVSNQAGKVGTAAHATVANQLAFTEAGAYNTILITTVLSATPVGTAPLANLKDFDDDFTDEITGNCADPRGADQTDALEASDLPALAVATIKNSRNNTSVKAYLVNAGAATGTADSGKNIFQGIVTVWDQEDGFDARNGACGDHGNPQRYTDTTPDNDADNPRLDDGWTDASGAVIPARDGDTLTITVAGVAGSVDVIVDGQGPDIDDVTPEAGGTQKSSTVNLGFTVSDDGSGIRYDNESGVSNDPDLTPHNGDNDNRFDEPITSVGPTHDPGAATPVFDWGDGSTMDIMVLFDTDDEGTQKPYLLQSDNTQQTDEPIDTSVDPAVPNDPNPMYTGYRVNFDATNDVSQYGTNDWTQRMRGVTYDLDMDLVGKGFGEYFWQITAKDRVGNMATTDSDEDEPGQQPFSFKVDDRSPKVIKARTGIGYEPGEGEFKNPSWIALNFENVTKAGEFEGGPDRIDAGTVEAADFTVEGNNVVNVVVPGDKKVCVGDDPRTPKDKEDESAKNITAFDAAAGKPAEDDDGNAIADAEAPKRCNFEPRARVYIELATPLDSDEKPTIQLLGGVLKDIAGNNNVTQSIEDDEVLLDRIAPGVSITITSDTGTTGRTATDKDGSFTVRVTSDEDLSRFPRLWFATIKGTDSDPKNDSVGAATGLMIDEVTDSLSLTEKETNVWEKTFDVDGLIGGTADRLMAVVVTATDEAGNPGNSAGWKGSGTPAADDDLDFKSLNAGGFLVEVDTTIEAAGIKVLPSTDPDNVDDETESSNPYIQITFSENNEYGISADEADDDNADTTEVTDTAADPNIAYTAAIKNAKPLATDSHPDVEITSLMLNDENRLKDVVRVKAGTYVLAVTGLEIGEYTISYVVKDDVGNEFNSAEEDEDFTFQVLERQPYEVELQPGWNLVSLPGDPFNTAVSEVVGSDLKADRVLGYQRGEWLTAVKNDEGRWQGTLTEIRGGYGYWVQTTAIETISTVIPPIAPGQSDLPTVPVISGWNLLGVVDAAQRKAGATEDADEYFTSLPAWRVAYSFETQQNRWAKLLPDGEEADGTEHTVANGRGYWVWSSRPGTLVP